MSDFQPDTPEEDYIVQLLLPVDEPIFPDEPDWDSPTDWDSVEPPDEPDFDEPPPDWKPPTLTEIDAPSQSLEEQRADLEASLAELSERLERADENENTIERYAEREELLEEQESLLEELEMLTAPEIGSDANSGEMSLTIRPDALNLVDARFLGRPDVDQNGSVTGYTLQCVEIYQDKNSDYTGRVLDVGHYDNSAKIESHYFVMQDAIASGELSIQAVAEAGEEVALVNGLDATAWRDATQEDFDLYEFHINELDQVTRDIPSEAVVDSPRLLAAAFTAANVDPEMAARQQELLANQQAIEALHAIGLEPPEDFTLRRDSYFDQETGDRVINGVFQQNPDDPTQNCRATFVSLSPGEEGLGFSAAAVEFGQVGSFEQALANRDHVQFALEQHGPSQAIDVIEYIQTELEKEQSPHLAEQTVEQPELEMAGRSWSRDID